MDIKGAIFHLKMIFRTSWNPGSCLPRGWFFSVQDTSWPGQDQSNRPSTWGGSLWPTWSDDSPFIFFRPYPYRPYIHCFNLILFTCSVSCPYFLRTWRGFTLLSTCRTRGDLRFFDWEALATPTGYLFKVKVPVDFITILAVQMTKILSESCGLAARNVGWDIVHIFVHDDIPEFVVHVHSEIWCSWDYL